MLLCLKESVFPRVSWKSLPLAQISKNAVNPILFPQTSIQTFFQLVTSQMPGQPFWRFRLKSIWFTTGEFPQGKGFREICAQMSMFSVFQHQGGFGGPWGSCCLPSIVSLRSPHCPWTKAALPSHLPQANSLWTRPEGRENPASLVSLVWASGTKKTVEAKTACPWTAYGWGKLCTRWTPFNAHFFDSSAAFGNSFWQFSFPWVFMAAGKLLIFQPVRNYPLSHLFEIPFQHPLPNGSFIHLFL